MIKRKRNITITIHLNYGKYVVKIESYFKIKKIEILKIGSRIGAWFKGKKNYIYDHFIPVWWGSGWRPEKEKPDYLDHNPSANNVAVEISRNFISSNKNSSYIFAVSGKWGEGKTDLLERVERKLILDHKIPVVWFKPWQYTDSPETIRRVFLREVNLYLMKFENPFNRCCIGIKNKHLLDSLKYETTENILNWVWCFVLVAVLVILQLISHFIFNQSILDFLTKRPSIAIIASIIGLATIVPNIIRIQRVNPKVTSADDFSTTFEKCLHKFKKIVILVDDLDRCTPDGAKMVLDSLKTYFNNDRVNYVLTGDHTVLERYLGSQLEVVPETNEDESKINLKKTSAKEIEEGRRFLKKLFNVYWRLPRPDDTTMRGFIDKTVGQIPNLDSSQNDQVIGLIMNFVERNPREVERFVGLMRFSLINIETRLNNGKSLIDNLRSNLEEVKNNPQLLAKVLLIQEKYDEEFTDIANNPARYAALEKEQLRNVEGYETTNAKSKLLASEKYNEFSNLVKTTPTFHNDRFVLIHPPEAFFYYSGFTGSGNIGIVSEDFLGRYVTADSNILDDLKGVPDDGLVALVNNGITNLDILTDINQSNQAINNLRNIYKGFSASWQTIDSFIDNTKVCEYFNLLPDDQKDLLIDDILFIVTSTENSNCLGKILVNDPWKSKSEKIWQSDLSEIPNELFEQLIQDVKRDEQNGVDVNFKKQKIINDFLNKLNDPQTSASKLVQVCKRMETTNSELTFGGVINNSHFAGVLNNAGNLTDSNRKNILLNFLKKDNQIWSILPSAPDLNLLQNKPPSGYWGKAGDSVYKSWYP